MDNVFSWRAELTIKYLNNKYLKYVFYIFDFQKTNKEISTTSLHDKVLKYLFYLNFKLFCDVELSKRSIDKKVLQSINIVYL